MTLDEFKIQLDISSGNETEVLKQYAYETYYGYIFVDSSDGQCYLLNKYGKLDDISKIKHIQDRVFENSTSFESITIPNSVKNIGSDAFAGCTSLESIIIPGSVKSIRKWAFWNCKSLNSIIIPNSVKSIGYYAFDSCTSLNEVIFKGKTIDQVNAMNHYPWGIKDTNVIKCR